MPGSRTAVTAGLQREPLDVKVAAALKGSLRVWGDGGFPGAPGAGNGAAPGGVPA